MLWSQFKTSFLTPARVVPVVMLAVNAGVTAAAAWLATKGWLDLDPAQTVAIVGPLAVGALAVPLGWQQGYQKYEARDATNASVVEEYDVHPEDLVPDAGDLDSEKEKATEATALKAAKDPKGRSRG